MTTTTLIVSAAVGTFWLILTIAGVLSWTLMSRKNPASERKQQNRQRPPAPAVDEQVFGSGLTIRIWKSAARGVYKAGLTLLRSTNKGMRQTLFMEQCLEIPTSMLFHCDVLEQQSWLLDEDRDRVTVLRAAMLAAQEVVLEAKQESRQLNGEATLNGNALA